MKLPFIEKGRIALPKEVWVGWAASFVEAYNMAIYSFQAPFLASQIFPPVSEKLQLIFSYALVFLGTLLLYPLGALYYGIMGDKAGRRKTCIYSCLGLGLSTGLMAVIPFGPGAFIAFLILIASQHFFSGGEYHGSTVFSLEHAQRRASGILSAIGCLFAVGGLVLASLFATISPTEYIVRLSFLVGAAAAGLSYLLKKSCQESPIFLQTKEMFAPSTLYLFIKKHLQEILLSISALAFFFVSYSYIFIFLPLVGNNPEASSYYSFLFYGLFLLLSGFTASRLGERKTMFIGMILFSISLFAQPPSLFLRQVILMLPACLAIAPIHSFLLHQFVPQNRCRGIFIASAIATALFGGSTVPLCLALFSWNNSHLLPGIYPLLIALGAISCTLIPQKKVII